MKTLESLPAILALSEDEARGYLEGIRWPTGPVCPHCGVIGESTKLQGSSTRPGVYKCRGCRKPYSVTVGTVMHRSKLPLSKWIAAFHLLCSSKKGISALQLQRQLGIGSYQAAWHMAHRIRHAMLREPLASMLSGTVEIDTTFVGGKPRKRPFGKSKAYKAPRWKQTKAPVLALVERGGALHAMPLDRVTQKNLKQAVTEHVHPAAKIMTDEASVYGDIFAKYASHETVCHGRGEYKRGEASTNEVEAYFALLKRSVMGAWHHVSKRHLGRYVDEVSFRWSSRKSTDGQRTALAMLMAGGKRLTYKVMKGR